MLFPHLDKYRHSDTAIDSALDSAVLFLSKVFSENLSVGEPQRKFNVSRFATNSGLPQEMALAVFNLCERESILESTYEFICPEHYASLGEFSSLSEVPSEFRCMYHESHVIVHKAEECRIEFYYHFTNVFLGNFKEYSY